MAISLSKLANTIFRTRNYRNRVVEVQASYVHERYGGNVGPYDIALLKLKSPLKLNNRVAAIGLPTAGAEPTGDVVLSGWGSISLSSTAQIPDILQTVIIPIVERKSCNASIEALLNEQSQLPLHEINICTGPLTGGIDACKGDSGGPLIAGDEIVSIVSWGFYPCGIYGAPSVYVKVSDYIDWISETIANDLA